MQILHLEDSDYDADLIQHVLRREWPDCSIRRVVTREDYQDALQTGHFDVILSDYSMPGFDGLIALGEARKRCSYTPFLFVSGMIGEERAVEALKHGATDYIIKDRPARLVPAIRQAIAFISELDRRRETEAALQATDERVRLITDSIAEHIMIVDTDGRRTYCNRACRDVFGEAVVQPGTDWYLVIDPHDVLRVREVFNRIVRTGHGEQFEFRCRCGDGNVRHMEATGAVLPSEDGIIRHLIIVARDMTERRQIEIQLREQASLLDKARDAIVATDLTHRITYWNASAERLYGLRAADVYGRAFNELGLGFDPVQFAAARAAVLAKGEWRGEFRFHAGGAVRIVYSTWSLVMENDGRPRSILAIDTDVTEQKKLETQLLRAQRLESVGTLAGGVAHDLNNVLTPILCTMDLLSGYVKTAEERQLIDKTRASAQHGAALIKQLLAFARGAEGERSTVDIQTALTGVEPLLRQCLPANVRLHVRCGPSPWAIEANGTQFNQALINLTLNARDAMPDGGELTVSTENVMVDAHLASANPGVEPGRFVRIAVADTGSGLGPDVQARIFDPFFTTKPTGKGTGLGLSMVAGILKSHGGFVQVESSLGRGSTFNLFFPAASIPAAVPNVPTTVVARPAEQSAVRGSGQRILLVDDEPAVRETLRSLLQRAGYAVLAAEDATTALRQYEIAGSDTALVITDMMLPDGSGVDVVKTIRDRSPKQPVIAISGMMDSGKYNELLQLDPPVECLSKPLLPRVLLNAVQRALHHHNDGNAAPAETAPALRPEPLHS